MQMISDGTNITSQGTTGMIFIHRLYSGEIRFDT